VNPGNKQLTFCRKQRLLAATDYQRVFDNVDCKQGGKYCTLLSARNCEPEPRLGLIAARKNLKLAVQRNLAKRLLRETFRLNRTAFLQLDHNFDVIALIKASAADAPTGNLRQELDKQWSKLIAKRLELDQSRHVE